MFNEMKSEFVQKSSEENQKGCEPQSEIQFLNNKVTQL